MKKKKHGIHHHTINELVNRLTLKPYCKDYITNLEYCFGELDLLSHQGNRCVYYEIKSNYTPKAVLKAYDQTQRWTKYAKNQFPSMEHYGVLYTPQQGFKILSKNGILR